MDQKATGRRNVLPSSSSSQTTSSSMADDSMLQPSSSNPTVVASHSSSLSMSSSSPSSPLPVQQQSQHQQQQQQQDSVTAVQTTQPPSINLTSTSQTAAVTTTMTDAQNRENTSSMYPIATGGNSSTNPTVSSRREYLQHSQSERLPSSNQRERPRFARSTSTKEVIKKYIKKETANFFGVDEETQEEQAQIWMDRRLRMASRAYGELKDEYTVPYGRTTRPKTYGGYSASGAVPREPREDRPDVLPSNLVDVTDSTVDDKLHERPLRRKDSVARLTWTGLSYVVTTLARHRLQTGQVRPSSRSFAPDEADSAPNYDDEGLEDEVFFQRPQSDQQSAPSTVANAPLRMDTPDGSSTANVSAGGDISMETIRYSSPSDRRISFGSHSTTQRAWKRAGPEQPLDQTSPTVGGSRVWAHLLDSALDNSDRRQYGMGWVGRMFGRSVRKSVAHEEHIRKQLDDLEDHRPFFTWWVTTVQVLVLVISLVCYGFGPVGFDLANRSGQVLVTSLSLQQVDYQEPANFWLGPRAADLIHLGAKFAPCMRRDAKIQKEIDKVREKERETACCIRNDDSGCVQSSRADCSKIISTWKKWSPGDSGPGGRISGSVCGLDPKYCDAPASVAPYEWPDDITKWPICRKTNGGLMEQARGHDGNSQTSLVGRTKDKMAEHMVCEVIGHPCCIGIHGQCRITTREYCDFVRGYFHEEASLCSQVSCMDDVCGMIPFYFPETPDQVYRLWTSLFLHAGVLQLIVTIIIQYTLMRDLEKLTGSLRIGIIYLGSGVAGNLASAIFVPYRAEVGPAGAQFGLLACLIVEVLNVWPMLRHPDRAFIKLLTITILLFIIGILPWVDNYAHLFGFVFGFLLSYALMPFVSFGPYDREKKIALIWVCLLSASFLFCCLIILFYVIPIYDCEICTYFNCVPLTRNFCASQNINFKREEPVV